MKKEKKCVNCYFLYSQHTYDTIHVNETVNNLERKLFKNGDFSTVIPNLGTLYCYKDIWNEERLDNQNSDFNNAVNIKSRNGSCPFYEFTESLSIDEIEYRLNRKEKVAESKDNKFKNFWMLFAIVLTFIIFLINYYK